MGRPEKASRTCKGLRRCGDLHEPAPTSSASTPSAARAKPSLLLRGLADGVRHDRTRRRRGRSRGPVGRSGAPWTRVVVEKPFGHDLASARALNLHLLEVFDERQLFRQPLPRQGDGSEPPRLPLRQQLVRAGVVARARRPRPNHVAESIGVEDAASSTSRPASRATSSRTT
ncbi:MAG: hypothetical protein U0235_12330 [Polyangiaceae bacterium]